MAHLVEYAIYVEGPNGPVTLWKGIARAEKDAKLQALQDALEPQGAEIFVEEHVLRVDIKQIVINLMGSSMGDLELVDVIGSTTKGGKRERFHVLRRKAFDVGKPYEVPPSPALAVLRHVPKTSNYEWHLTCSGFDYILDNEGIQEECVRQWALKALKDAPEIFPAA